MILFLVAYLGGVLTILSPCILPVLPFVFARADRPFMTSGLPLLLGMAITFAAVATLAAVGGGWAVEANHYGRIAAILLLALFGVALLYPELADRMTRPLVALGSQLSQHADSNSSSGRSPFLASFLLGIATGLLWAPCAGPILGLVLTGAALEGASIRTSFLLFAYAAGAATSLGVALLIGGRVFTAMKRSLGAGEWIRRGLGVAVLAGVVVISLGLDRGFLTRVALTSTNGVEQTLLDTTKLRGVGQPAEAAPTMAMTAGHTTAGDSAMMMMAAKPAVDTLPVEGQLPSLSGAVEWLNSPPLTAEGLRGKVVLIDFWTYSCINCLRTLPYVEAWAAKYKDQGLVVIGVHSPEFAFEKDVGNVRQAVKDLKILYPVAIDSNYAIWRAFGNEYWPAQYFVDAQGRIRHHHFGEGGDAQSEQVIQQLLAEAGHSLVPHDMVDVAGQGVEEAADFEDIESPETYIGYERAQNFVSPGGAVQDQSHVYADAPHLELNQWALAGDWTVQAENAILNRATGSITYRFHARDLHLVLGPSNDGKPVRFRVSIDGKPPLGDHGADVDDQGNGTVTEQRLYQLVRQSGPVTDRDFQIEFLDPGAQAFSFTFG